MTAGKPWEKPGYRFSIDWPPGFVPQPWAPTVESEALKAARRANLTKGRDRANFVTKAAGEGIHSDRPAPKRRLSYAERSRQDFLAHTDDFSLTAFE